MSRNQLTLKNNIAFLFVLLSMVCSWTIGFTQTASANGEAPLSCIRQWYSQETVAATALGIDEMVLYQALNEGKSMADVAAEMGIDKQVIIDALVDVESDLVRKLERGGCFTAAEAETQIAALPEKMLQVVEATEEVDGPQPQQNTIFLPIVMG